MIDRFLILIFFCIFLFVPIINNFTINKPARHTSSRFNTEKKIFKNHYNVQSNNDIVEAIAKVSQSVVGISVININDKQPVFEVKNGIFIPYTKDKEIKTLGSGLIYSNDGYVITNTHVVKNANKIFVTLTGGKKFEAKLIGSDDLTDIALLKVDSNQLLPVSNLGNSNNLNIGQWVIALGNPLGLFDLSYQPTATIGIISGLNIDFGIKENSYVYKDMIQTDASINEGNSGGPLINIFGEVIGINTFIMTVSNIKQGSIGIAFSIPINRVKDIIHELILYGEIKRSYSTGFKIKPMNLNVKKYLNVPFDQGAVIIDVEKKSAAMDAGLQVGDIIFKVDDIVVNSNQDFININNENLRKSGDIVILEVWRAGTFYTIELELKNYK
ncbi:trypsin-like peptidase domain-containing protein [bacterium]|nr:trypsin-like peptidase domain-containing protein [bacterium]